MSLAQQEPGLQHASSSRARTLPSHARKHEIRGTHGDSGLPPKILCNRRNVYEKSSCWFTRRFARGASLDECFGLGARRAVCHPFFCSVQYTPDDYWCGDVFCCCPNDCAK